ncbi:PilZ domain-containing protein [Maridesulfovibrio frigidus]|uniref:PilZ domain-containing protein n=1 Tax=Maridesulfovibrio frigidus TaxID=340956 RepID=UPI00068FC5ED|nr:PilZ domain-containing protein [Maridesulfovibrio frigidus]
MENFDFQSILDKLDKLDFRHWLDKLDLMVINPAIELYKSLPPESLPIILAIAGGIGLLASIIGYIILRPSPKKGSGSSGKSNNFISSFKNDGVILDIAEPDAHDNLFARAVITDIQEDRLQLELVEDLGLSKNTDSRPMLIMFPPEKTETGSVNCFKTIMVSVDCRTENCGRITISTPTKFSSVKRRRHKRKRVIDQQFIRVKMWLGAPDTDDASFADAVPDLAVNSYDPRSGGHEDNEVINISNGGIGVSTPLILSENKFDTGTNVLINIFMFNFRQKVFKPYWYAGQIRTVENIDRATCRLGVEFTMSGTLHDENEQLIDWTEI